MTPHPGRGLTLPAGAFLRPLLVNRETGHMNKVKRCIDCRRRITTAAAVCDRCKAERDRVRELHGSSHASERDECYAALKAPRVAAYARRAEKGLPLFDPPLSPEELRG